MADITIIGAGIVGMACASYLQRDGHKVTVVDERPPGEYCSLGNAGILSPGSCVPFGLPGIMTKVPGWLTDPMGPLTVRWQHVPAVLPWMVRFMRNAQEDRIDGIADALRALLRQTFDAYAPLVKAAACADLIRQTGYLAVYESEKAFRGDSRAWKMRRERGVVCEDLDASGIRELEPALRGIYTNGVWLPEQGHVANPLRLTQALAKHFVTQGGVLEQRRVLDVEVGPDGPRALQTDAGSMPVATLLVCAGVHSNTFSRRFGDDVPLESQRGYHVTFEGPTVSVQRPIMSGEHKFFVTPMETGLRFAGAVEFAGTGRPPNYARADALTEHARRMIPELGWTNASKWMGHRPCMPDSLPVIGRSAHVANVFYAFGHGHIGLCGGAPTARLVADLIGGRAPSLDARPFRVDRF